MAQLMASTKIGSRVAALLFLAALAYAAITSPQFPDPGKPPMNRQQQIQMGFQAASQVYQQMPVLPDNSPETQYIRQVGQKLVATIPPEHTWPYEFHTIPQKEINAFALPGGQMFVNIGTVTAAANEAELAGVMGHEMSHVYMQHSAKQAAHAQKVSEIFGIGGGILGTQVHGVLGTLAQSGIQFGEQGLMLKYSRGDEAQADAVGSVIMYKAGYNPQALANFFKKLEAQGGTGPQFLSDHPNPGNRTEAIEKEIATWPPEAYTTASPAFDAAHQHALGVKAYSAQEIAQGAKSGEWAQMNHRSGASFKPAAAESFAGGASAPPAGTVAPAEPVNLQSVLPSSRMATMDLPGLKIAHPDNWQLMAAGQNARGIRIAPPAGVRGGDLGYGVFSDALRPQNGHAFNLDQLTAELVSNLESGGDLTPVGQAQPITVFGAQGRSVNLQSNSPFPDANGRPQKEKDWLVTAPHPRGSMLYFIFVAPQSEFERFRPSFESMLKSVQFRQ